MLAVLRKTIRSCGSPEPEGSRVGNSWRILDSGYTGRAVNVGIIVGVRVGSGDGETVAVEVEVIGDWLIGKTVTAGVGGKMLGVAVFPQDESIKTAATRTRFTLFIVPPKDHRQNMDLQKGTR